MEYRTLLYFTTFVDEGSFTKAAKKLHISQPSLSSSIIKMEENMDLLLIDRSTRKFSLTIEGEILYKEAKKLLHHFHHVEKEMIRLKQDGPLNLQIGLIESVNSWLPKVISTYSKINPDIYIKLSEVLGPNQVAKALQDYKIHLAITNQLFENNEIKTTPIYKEELVALLPKGHALSNKKSINIFDLKDDELIISKEGFQTRDDIINEFRKSGITPHIKFEIERFETACSLVEEGLGVTFVPENYINHIHGQSFSIKHIENSHLFRTVYIAHLKDRYLPPVIEIFIKEIQDFFLE